MAVGRLALAGFASAVILMTAVGAGAAPARAADATAAPDVSLEPAIRAFDAGDYERAVTLLRALAPDVAGGAEAQFYLGYSLLRLERWADALVAGHATWKDEGWLPRLAVDAPVE